MEQKIDDIKFGLLTDQELNFLEHYIIKEREKRKENNPEEYIDVVYARDGSEGFYCKIENFHKINSVELHTYISQTLRYGSEISFAIEKFSVSDYAEYCARYEWDFNDDEESIVKFRVDHDDQPNEIVDKIATALSEFGIEINEIDSGDGFMHYQIIETDDNNELKINN